MKNAFFLNDMKCFCHADETDFHLFEACLHKVYLELNAQNHFFRASKSTNSVFSANDEIARPQVLKNFFSEKKLLNAILRAKLKNMKNVSF